MSSVKIDDMAKNHPAFPVPAFAGDGKNPSVRPNSGMQMLDFYAAFSLAGYRAAGMTDRPDYIADLAYADAEAMLRQKEHTT